MDSGAVHRFKAPSTISLKASHSSDTFKVSIPRTLRPAEHGLQVSSVSKGARKIIEELKSKGFQAELVGGCVRDLLLNKIPKDFDVATDATPEQVRHVFARSRIIGRRFRIVHVRMGREVIEVSTYRASSESNDLKADDDSSYSASGRILRDNVFGSRDQDVVRRDFTINALYYDTESNTVTDYVDGFSDVKKQVLQFIGDPARRIEEDPVRMLRIARFKSKLDLFVDPACEALCRESAYLLRQVPPARLFDEILKLFHSGFAVRVFLELRSMGLFSELFSEADRVFNSSDIDPDSGIVFKGLENTDRRIDEGKPVIAAFLFAVLLWRCVSRRLRLSELEKPVSLMQMHHAAIDVLGRQVQRVAIPRRISTVVMDIWDMQVRLEARRPRTIKRLLEHKRFRAGYDFLLLRSQAGEVKTEIADWWTKIQEVNDEQAILMIQALTGPKSQSKRRRRPRKRQPRRPSE